MRNLINYIIFLVGIWTNLCAQEFELNIDNVNEQYGSFDLLYSSAVDVQGFELNIQGVEIISANSDIFTTFQVNSENGFVIGYSFGSSPEDPPISANTQGVLAS
ncbi:uncharacterized protein METZ01_LOCUS517792, partial [marine metagenome]